MGKKLEKIFILVEEKKGNNGRIKLSQISKITRKLAEQIDDDQKVYESLKKIASEIINDDINKFI